MAWLIDPQIWTSLLTPTALEICLTSGTIEAAKPQRFWTNYELSMINNISAVTLATHDMRRAVSFYRMLGFQLIHGDESAAFTSFRAGAGFLNLIAQPAERQWSWWGRLIFYESDVDALYARVIAAGYRPEASPRDAEWGERYFHLTDPDGHELSFAWPSSSSHPS